MTANSDKHGLSMMAAILAGGEASRYGGAPKGLIEIAPGETIIQRLIREIADSGISETVILANDPVTYKPLGLPVIGDLRPGNGPLGGIEAALIHARGRSDAILVLPCDLPGITSHEIAALLRAFAEEGAGLVYAHAGRFSGEPLCAIVHNGLLGDLSRLIDEGKLKVSEAWRELGGRPVVFVDPRPFFNVNTPEDLARWRALQGGSSMMASVCVPEDMADSVKELIRCEGIDLNVVTEGECDLRVVRSEGRAESDLSTLQSGGWIKCEVALAMAAKLGISTRNLGKLLDFVNVKVRECGLGCF